MKRVFSLVVLVVGFGALFAQNGSWQFRFGPRFWGGSMGTRYSLEEPEVDGVESAIVGTLSAAYEFIGYQRTAMGRLLTVDPAIEDAITEYARFDLLWQLGVEQGLLPRSDSPDDRAVAFALYRGRYRLPFTESDQLVDDAGLPRAAPLLQGSIVSGVAYSTRTQAQLTRVVQGVTGEFALEWGPEFLHNELLGSSDFNRLTLKGSAFLPIVEVAPENGMNRFALYGAAFAGVDWATGPVIPFSVRSTIGGRSVRSAPGGTVRGYGAGRFDATFKAIGNFELRASLPSVGLPLIIPGLVLFTDLGYYLDTEELSPLAAENSGFLLSSGVGASIDLFAAAQFVFYTAYSWTETNVRGEQWIPFALGFGFHF
ncbi:MAG: hypothetical protein ACLFP4_05120 [Spirochaetales bacterium]